jgi:hypothetical protein
MKQELHIFDIHEEGIWILEFELIEINVMNYRILTFKINITLIQVKLFRR